MRLALSFPARLYLQALHLCGSEPRRRRRDRKERNEEERGRARRMMGRREEAGDKEESKETFEEKKMEEQEKLRIFREGSIEDAFPQPCNWLFHSAPCALRCKVQTWLTSSSFHKSGLV